MCVNQLFLFKLRLQSPTRSLRRPIRRALSLIRRDFETNDTSQPHLTSAVAAKTPAP